jgi:hypothetical protein
VIFSLFGFVNFTCVSLENLGDESFSYACCSHSHPDKYMSKHHIACSPQGVSLLDQ